MIVVDVVVVVDVVIGARAIQVDNRRGEKKGFCLGARVVVDAVWLCRFLVVITKAKAAVLNIAQLQVQRQHQFLSAAFGS